MIINNYWLQWILNILVLDSAEKNFIIILKNSLKSAQVQSLFMQKEREQWKREGNKKKKKKYTNLNVNSFVCNLSYRRKCSTLQNLHVSIPFLAQIRFSAEQKVKFKFKKTFALQPTKRNNQITIIIILKFIEITNLCVYRTAEDWKYS